MPQTIISNVVRTNILREANIFLLFYKYTQNFQYTNNTSSPKNVP